MDGPGFGWRKGGATQGRESQDLDRRRGELGSSGRIDGRVEMSDTGWDIIREGKLF